MALAGALLLGGCAGGIIDGPPPQPPIGPTTPPPAPAPPAPPPSGLPALPTDVSGLSCAAIERDLISYLEQHDRVLRTWASVDNTACDEPPGGDLIEYPSVNVSVAPDITPAELVAMHESLRAAWAAYIDPKVRSLEDLEIHVDGRAHIEWLGYTALDLAMAEEILDVTAADRFVHVDFMSRLYADGTAGTGSLGPDAPKVMLYVDSLGITDAPAMTDQMGAGWTAAQDLAAALDGTAILSLVDGRSVRGTQTTGLNLDTLGGSFVRLDIPGTGQMPDAWGEIAVRTLEFEDRPDLRQGEIHARDEDAYARFVLESGYYKIDDETQTLLDDITALLVPLGIDIERTYEI